MYLPEIKRFPLLIPHTQACATREATTTVAPDPQRKEEPSIISVELGLKTIQMGSILILL